jgi:hypothetical protein
MSGAIRLAAAEADELPEVGMNLPGHFWEARPALATIRQAAHARTRSPDAVLGAVLARVALTVPPALFLPPVTGHRGTVDLLVAVVAPAGGGKSTSVAVAGDLFPVHGDGILDDLTIGSGEGLVDAYMGDITEQDGGGKTRRTRGQVRHAILAVVDEGQVLKELGARKGSTLLPIMRSAWSGATLGQANASAETKRRLEAGSYRLALVAAFQPEYAATILDDAAGGTPQRFLWLSATDPAIPDVPPAWLGPLTHTPPRFTAGQVFTVDPAVAEEVRTRQLCRSRAPLDRPDPSGEPLDSHLELLRLKVGALLGYLDGRAEVSRDDWRLAGIVLDTSTAVRQQVAAIARDLAANREKASTARAVRRDETIEGAAQARALERVSRAVANRVRRGPGVVLRRDLNHAIASRDRTLAPVDAAIAHAEAKRWIVPSGDGWKPGTEALA